MRDVFAVLGAQPAARVGGRNHATTHGRRHRGGGGAGRHARPFLRRGELGVGQVAVVEVVGHGRGRGVVVVVGIVHGGDVFGG